VTVPAAQRTVTVYTRPGCHLCDEAIAVVRLIADGRADIELIDIDADPALTERYTVRVPVVAVDGVEVAQYQIAPEQLEAALAG
jgi:glutaredoxin